MKIDVVTLFPEVIESYVNIGIIGRALEKKLLKINYVNLRDFSLDKHRRVDDYPYGGGPGDSPLALLTFTITQNSPILLC